MNYAQTLGERAKVAAPAIANASPKLKNEALAAIAAALLQQTDRILQANAEDLAAAVQNNMTESLPRPPATDTSSNAGYGRCH